MSTSFPSNMALLHGRSVRRMSDLICYVPEVWQASPVCRVFFFCHGSSLLTLDLPWSHILRLVFTPQLITALPTMLSGEVLPLRKFFWTPPLDVGSLCESKGRKTPIEAGKMGYNLPIAKELIIQNALAVRSTGDWWNLPNNARSNLVTGTRLDFSQGGSPDGVIDMSISWFFFVRP